MPEPLQPNLPSRATLLRATLAAVAIATIILVLVVLPAEYGIDPTGFGGATGIAALGASGASAPVADPANHAESRALRNDTLVLTVEPNFGLEYKFKVAEDSGFAYAWTATGPLFFDFHGDRLNDTSGNFVSFLVGETLTSQGLFEAPFEGRHGWYWENRSDQAVTLTLRLTGFYDVVGRTG